MGIREEIARYREERRLIIALLEEFASVDRLQTFSDRERFRTLARTILLKLKEG